MTKTKAGLFVLALLVLTACFDRTTFIAGQTVTGPTISSSPSPGAVCRVDGVNLDGPMTLAVPNSALLTSQPFTLVGGVPVGLPQECLGGLVFTYPVQTAVCRYQGTGFAIDLVCQAAGQCVSTVEVSGHKSPPLITNCQ